MEAVHKSPGIYLTAEKTGKPQLGDHVMKIAISHRLKWDSLPQNNIYRIARHIREGDGRKEGKDRVILFYFTFIYILFIKKN